MEPIYEGKAKRLFTTDDPNVLRMEFKDSATAFNGVKKEDFANKGRMNKAITLIIYRMLEQKGVKTHLVDDVDDTNLLVKKVSIMPLEVSVPMRMPAEATHRIVRRGATFDPRAALRKLTASLASPTTMPSTASTASTMTMKVNRGDILRLVRFRCSLTGAACA